MVMLMPIREQCSYGTAAVAIWTPEKMVFAADSKQRKIEMFGSSDNGTVCKIKGSPE